MSFIVYMLFPKIVAACHLPFSLTQASKQDIPIVVKSCIRFINLNGKYALTDLSCVDVFKLVLKEVCHITSYPVT